MRRVWPVALVGALAACQAILGIEDTSESNGSSSGGGADGGGSGGTGAAEASVGGSGAKDASGDATDAKVDTGGEDCGNGFDDDEDGDVDCADSDCVGWKCAPGVPPGFTGPVAYWEGPTGSEPACAAPFDVELATLFADLDCPDAECPCDCGNAANQTCTNGMSMWWSKSGCPINNVSDNLSSSCDVPSVSSPDHVVVLGLGGSKTQGGNCTATGGPPQKTTTWNTTGRICGASLLEGGCAGGTECVPDPGALLGPCIFRTGDVACPLSGYSDKHVVYETTTDTRSCSSCTCGGASGGSCSQNVITYSDTGCSQQSGSFNTSANCATVSNVVRFKFTPTVTVSGSCPPQVTPTGACAEANPTTVCCQPKT